MDCRQGHVVWTHAFYFVIRRTAGVKVREDGQSIDIMVDEIWRNDRASIEGRSSVLIVGRSPRGTSKRGSQDG